MLREQPEHEMESNNVLNHFIHKYVKNTRLQNLQKITVNITKLYYQNIRRLYPSHC